MDKKEMDRFVAEVQATMPPIEYDPNPSIVIAEELAWAILRTLRERMGQSFVDDVAGQLARAAQSFERGSDDNKKDAAIIREVLDEPIWKEVRQPDQSPLGPGGFQAKITR